MFRQDRYIRLDNKLLQPNSICHRGVVYNSKLRGDNNGRIGSNRFCFRISGIYKSRDANKNFKRTRNPETGLQGRVIYCSKTFCNSRVVLNRYSCKVFECQEKNEF